jgi:hypothetical protein
MIVQEPIISELRPLAMLLYPRSRLTILNMQLPTAMLQIQEATGLILTGTLSKESMEETKEEVIPSTIAGALLSIWHSVSQPPDKELR